MADASTPRQLTPEAFENVPEIVPPQRYTWLGTFGERYEEDGSKWVEAYCGGCYTEISQAWRDLEARCPFCKTRCWTEPLVKPQVSSYDKGTSISPGSTRPATPVPAPVQKPEVPTPTSEGTSGDILLSSSNSSESGELGAGMAAISLAPTKKAKPPTVARSDPNTPIDPAIQRLLEIMRGRGRAKSESQEEKSTVSSTGSGMLLGSSTRRRYPRPNWAVMDFGPLPKCSLPEEEYKFQSTMPPTDSTPKGKAQSLPPEWPCTPPPPYAFSKDTSCWVAPGRADSEKFRSVSRVQRLINTQVYEKWGYYMPYAPEWVYDEVTKHVDEWLYGELVRREKLGPGGVFKKDPERRHRDVDYLYDIAQEWWFGRTILKHGVKSCGKYQEERNFALSSDLPSGGRIDKPHPAYYVSYEVTKAKYERNMH